MLTEQALDLFGQLPSSQSRALWKLGTPVAGYELERGIWHGRNGAMPGPIKWFVRNVVKRDYFAKLLIDDFGVNIRVRQDGSNHFLPAADGPGVKVDMPFALADGGLDYGFHVLGREPSGLQLRDYLRVVDFQTVTDVVPEALLAKVGVRRGEGGDGSVVVGYIAPLGIEALKGTPFGMIRVRDALPEEERSAWDYLATRRLFDSAVLTG